MTCRSASVLTAAAVLAGLLASAGAAPAAPPARGCGAVKGYAARQVCLDPEVRRWDADLHKMLDAVLAAIPAPRYRAVYVQFQKDWEVRVRDACHTKSCLKDAYAAHETALVQKAHRENIDF